MNPYLFLFISHSFIESTILEQLSHFQNIHLYIDEQNRSQQKHILEQISQHVNIHHQNFFISTKQSSKIPIVISIHSLYSD